MLIDLSGILAREGEQKTFSISPEGEYFSCQLGDFAYAEKGPVTLTVTHTGKAGGDAGRGGKGFHLDSLCPLSGTCGGFFCHIH